MVLVFWDASALVKRFLPEMGSDVVDEIFANRAGHQMATTAWCYAETFSIILRRSNGGTLDRATFAAAASALETEVAHSREFGMLAIPERTIFASIPVMRRHNLNSADAVMLAVLSEYRLATASTALVVTSDKRLARSATSDGFEVINPEEATVAAASATLAGLAT